MSGLTEPPDLTDTRPNTDTCCQEVTRDKRQLAARRGILGLGRRHHHCEVIGAFLTTLSGAIVALTVVSS